MNEGLVKLSSTVSKTEMGLEKLLRVYSKKEWVPRNPENTLRERRQ